MRDEYEYYRKKSKSELLETLVRLTDEQKQSGAWNDASSAEETYRILAPFLSDAQQRTLRAILNELN